jgi:hypothetical protein
MGADDKGDVTQLLAQWAEGNRQAQDSLPSCETSPADTCASSAAGTRFSPPRWSMKHAAAGNGGAHQLLRSANDSLAWPPK